MDKWLKTYINNTILNSHLLDWWKTWGYSCWEEWWRRRKWKYKGGLITKSLEKYFSLEKDFIREGWWWWKLTCTAFHLRPLEIACLHLIFLRCVYAKARRRLQLSKDPLLEAGPVLYIMLLVTLRGNSCLSFHHVLFSAPYPPRTHVGVVYAPPVHLETVP